MFKAWHLFGTQKKISLNEIARLSVAVFVYCFANTSYADESSTSNPLSTHLEYQVGADVWQISASTSEDLAPGYVEDRTYLLLPDYNTKWSYKKQSTYGWLTGRLTVDGSTYFSMKVQANQYLGLRVDEAQIEKYISPFLGLRLGVVDYKTSWCRTYESNSIWMRDIEPLCNLQTYRDITGGAPGAQVFVQNTWDPYIIQAQVGIYRPKMLGYAPKEYGDLYPAPSVDYEYDVLSNKKTGFNINLLDTIRSIEARFSYIKGIQEAYTPASDLQARSRQSSKANSAAVSFPIQEKITTRFTRFAQTQDGTCRSEVANFSGCNSNIFYKKVFNSVEMSYQITARQSVGFGVTKIRYDLRVDNYDASSNFQVFLSFPPRSIDITQKNLAWRINWGGGMFTQVQYLTSKQNSSYLGSTFLSDGRALGLRFGYQF